MFFMASFAIYCFTMLQSCMDNEDNPVITEVVDEARLVSLGKEYIYFAKDSLYLNLSETEAIKKGVTKNEYFTLVAKLREMNLFLKETINGLADGKKISFAVPENRVLDSLNISDKFSIKYLSPTDMLQLTNNTVTRANAFQVSSYDGEPQTSSYKNNPGTYDLELNGSTKCAFALVRAWATVGITTIETGTGFTVWTAKASMRKVYCDGYLSVSVAGTCECLGTLIMDAGGV